MHQVVVKIDGWREVSPVSVDRVGVYFRQADPEINTSSSLVHLDLMSSKFFLRYR